MSTKTITEEEYTEAFDVNRNRWLYEPTMYKNRLYHALSHEPLNGCGGRTPNGKYEILPSNTLVCCDIEDGNGNILQERQYARIVDQREFYDTVYYFIDYPIGSNSNNFHTRSEKIYWPKPNDKMPEKFRKDIDDLNLKSSKLVECDYCKKRTIDPDDLDVSDINLADVGGGYGHERCVPNEQLAEYRNTLEKDEKDEIDENNAKIIEIMKTQGPNVAAQKMFEHPTEKDKEGNALKLSYSEMRSLYG